MVAYGKLSDISPTHTLTQSRKFGLPCLCVKVGLIMFEHHFRSLRGRLVTVSSLSSLCSSVAAALLVSLPKSQLREALKSAPQRGQALQVTKSPEYLYARNIHLFLLACSTLQLLFWSLLALAKLHLLIRSKFSALIIISLWVRIGCSLLTSLVTQAGNQICRPSLFGTLKRLSISPQPSTQHSLGSLIHSIRQA
jgi:hypothetical protein